MEVPVHLSFISHGSKHLGHRMIYSFRSTVGGGVIRASKNAMGTQEGGDGTGKFSRKMRAVVRQKAFGHTPLWDVLVYQNVRGTFRGVTTGGNSVHDRMSAKSIRKQQDVLITTIRQGQRAKIIPRNYFTRPIREWHRNNRPTNCLA